MAVYLQGDGVKAIFRECLEKCPGVRMTGLIQHNVRRTGFHDGAGIHHGQVSAQLPGDFQIMGDYQQAFAHVRHLPKQVKGDLPFGRVQPFCGLVRDDQPRWFRHGHNGQHTLVHAPGKLPWKFFPIPGREPHLVKKFCPKVPGCCPG